MRVCGSLVVSLVVFLVVCGVASAQTIKITFVDVVEVDGPSIFMGDISHKIEGKQLTKNQIDVVQSLRLKYSPLVGRPPVTIDADFIGNSLKIAKRALRKVGLEPSSFDISKSTKVLVSRKSQSVDAQELISFAQSALLEELTQRFNGGEYQIEADTSVPNLSLPTGKLDFSLRRLRSQFLAGDINVYLDISIDGVNRKSVKIPFSVKLTSKVLIAKKNFTRGDPLDLKDFEGSTQTLGQARLAPVHETQLKQMRANRRVSKGTVLISNMVERIPKILSGKLVTIVANFNGVRVKSSGTALADGFIGQEISVKNRLSKRVIFGVVMPNGDVQVAVQ
ncbi:flagella basal body P-ring formation protein FlgA [Candidatus Poribacteria bacterium]|nr:flagella basal body P-ring formation protein FlgA [Candidatus Poribacteria bacterium]